MTTPKQTPPRMTVDQFLVWAEGRPGRHELIGGEVVAQASERAKHWKIKLCDACRLAQRRESQVA